MRIFARALSWDLLGIQEFFMKSMTGYGRSVLDREHLHISVEIRCVNSRYFSLSSKISPILFPYEPEIKKILNEKLTRGTITLTIVHRNEAEPIDVDVINTNLLRQYFQKLTALTLELGMDRVRLDTLLHLPGVLESETGLEESCLSQSAWNDIRQVLQDALNQMESMMLREGDHLQKEIEWYCKEIEHHIQNIEKLVPSISTDFHQKLSSRMQILSVENHFPLPQEDILKEVALFAEKADITEEIVRLKSHLVQLANNIHESGPIAKKIEFILQEMVREANTISSKASHAECSQLVVALKSSVEKIREQIQNVE